MTVTVLFLLQLGMVYAIHKLGQPILVIQENSVVSVTNGSSHLVYQASNQLIDVLFYKDTNNIYFIENSEIQVYELQNNKRRKLLSFPETMNVNVMALDTQAGYLFWADSANQTIYISKMGQNIKPVVYFNKDIYSIRSIQLDTSKRLLVTSVLVGSITQIYRFEYNGANKIEIAHVDCTNSFIALDSLSSRLYISDKYKSYVRVYSYTAPYTEHAPIHLTTPSSVAVSSLAVANNTLYVTDSYTPGVLVVGIRSADNSADSSADNSADSSADNSADSSATDTSQQYYILQQYRDIRGIVPLTDLAVQPQTVCSPAICPDPQLCSLSYTNSTPVAKCFCAQGYSLNSDAGYCDSVASASQLYLCQNARSIPIARKCDGVNDCWDNSDERLCNDCSGYTCPDDTCLPSEAACDAVLDCEDGADEANCTCTSDQFRCNSGQCIEAAGRCNKAQQCQDRSDEHGCNICVQDSDFFCSSDDECIPGEWQCDGVYDCSDLSDEMHCQVHTCNETTQQQCDKTKCLEKEYVCDGEVNCRDMTDELTCEQSTVCEAGYLACSNGTCVEAALFCNGADDCGDGSDENCDYEKLLCNTSEFECGSGSCIPQGWQCDGKVDCADAHDETDCDDDPTDVPTCNVTSCSQTCNRGACACQSGYILAADNKTCTAEVQPRLYYIAGQGLYYTDFADTGVTLVYQHSTDLVAFDILQPGELLLVADARHIFIVSTNTSLTVGTAVATTVTRLVKREAAITRLAGDWINNNVYWVEEGGRLMMSNTQHTGLKTLLSSDVREIALDPLYQDLYYTTASGALRRCRLDASVCDAMTPDNTVDTFYIDQVNRRLYYATNSSFLYLMTTSGTSYFLSKLASPPQQLLYFESKVLYTSEGGVLRAYDRISGEETNVTAAASARLAHSTVQPSNSPSLETCPNSHCPQLCTQLSPVSPTCVCSDLYELSSGACRYEGPVCDAELKCDDRGCMDRAAQRCDGFTDCYDHSDEAYCNVTCNDVTEFKCSMGGCVRADFRCDTRHDCLDGSDERGCSSAQCSGFRCHNELCISERLKCNRHDDCGDNSDESEALCGYTPCGPNLFECAPNSCIPHSWRCNGYMDCGNGTDEEGCDEGHCLLKCDYRAEQQHRCLPASARCNDIADCADGSDEANCSSNCHGNTTSCACYPGEFGCKDKSACISVMLRCDGEAQCLDGSDERNCGKCQDGDVMCDTGKCVSQRYKCDGENQCPLGEDELDCPVCDDVTQLACDGHCFPRAVICDGKPDCSDGQDEASCQFPSCSAAEFPCRFPAACIDKHYRCDGSYDCVDRSDEENCPAETCPLSSFLCHNGVCLDQDLTCNGVDNCGDGSDEKRCETTIDECNLRPCDLTHGRCVDLRLGYYCKCDAGYVLTGNKKHCIDENECDGSHLCSQICINREGWYVCDCFEGYSLDRVDKATCKPRPPPSLLLISYHSIYMLSNMLAPTSDIMLLSAGETVHHAALHYVSPDKVLVYTAEGESLKRYTMHPRTSGWRKRDVIYPIYTPVLDPEWTTINNVHASSLAVEWATGNIYWTDSVFGEVKLVSNTSTVDPISVVNTFCDKPRNLVVVPAKGRMFFIHMYYGIPGIASCSLDGRQRTRLTGSVIVAFFDVDIATNILYYITPNCYKHDVGLPCLIGSNLDGTGQFYIRNLNGVINSYNPPTAFKVFASHAYISVGFNSRDITRCKLFDDYACSSVDGLPHISDFLIYSPLSQPPSFSNTCEESSCEAGMMCVNIPRDDALFQATCVCPDGQMSDGRNGCVEASVICDEEEYYPCQTGGCVPLHSRCDGIADCQDSSDEVECADYTCNTLLQFPCHSGNQCIPVQKRCDGYEDCSDRSDEMSCNSASLCNDAQLFCSTTKTCVPLAWRCDGTADCYHDTTPDDEQDCPTNDCPEDQPFKCTNNAEHPQCFPLSVKVDGKGDCYYRDDERRSRSCTEDMFQCETSSLCFPDSWRSDGEKDCHDGSDETLQLWSACPPGHLLSQSEERPPLCVSQRMVCDQWFDLSDYADEEHCFDYGSRCNSTQYECRAGYSLVQCFPNDWLCDGVRDCYGGTGVVYGENDEVSCGACGKSQRPCDLLTTECVEPSYWCDNAADCSNEADEASCNFACGPNDFTCSQSGRCLRNSVGVCDGADDCLDGSDESLCPVSSYPTCPGTLYDCQTDEALEQRCVAIDGAAADCPAACTNRRDVMRCGHGDACETSNGGCAHTCTPLADDTRKCGCYYGYELEADGRSCRDKDECLDPATCSQICTNLKGTYVCSCVSGFVKSGEDGSGCKPISGPPQILVSTAFDLRISTPRTYTKLDSGARRPYKYAFYSATDSSLYFIFEIVDRFILKSVSWNSTDPSSVLGEEVTVSPLEGHVTDLHYDPIGHNVIYTNQQSVIILALHSLKSITIFEDMKNPVQKIAPCPAQGLVFYIRDWMVGVMTMEGKQAHYLATNNLDFRRYQMKDGKVTGIAVDAPGARVYWYNQDLQQLSSSTFQGDRLTTVFNKLKGVEQLLVHGDEVYWHTGNQLWHGDKRTGSFGVREFNLPKCNFLSVLDTTSRVECAGCSGICRMINSYIGPTMECMDCSGGECECSCMNHGTCSSGTCSCPDGYHGDKCQLAPCCPDNGPCPSSPCQNGGDCAEAANGTQFCFCPPGYTGAWCQDAPSSVLKMALAVCLSLAVVALLLFLAWRYRRRYSLASVKSMFGNPAGVFSKTSVRYARQTNVSLDNGPGEEEHPGGVVNQCCEEYPMEELTDQCQLIDKIDEEDII